MSSELWVDGDLLEPGNHEALRQMCALSARRLSEIRNAARIGHDDAFDFVVAALEAIAGGDSPNDAFGFSRTGRGAPKGNFAFRDWEIRMAVQQRMNDARESLEAACGAVSDEAGGEFLLGYESIRKICRGLRADADLPMPVDIYPLTSIPYRRTK
ncbi:hypothetical protein E8F11_22020 [Pseudomonas sp. BN417]|uniref:hypothetical protein n=1 Tax=Pseudomonas sp. BN417 TaxID=2567890 RepID=UPI0024542928|nr:hypothetical protein [Pseudomonas sp. BN417]MDH4557814.1 hypothetical protein [Pseudomonas sp. BN417]